MSVLDSTSLVGRKGVVTMEDAARAACLLGEFDRRRLAEELGVKPLAVGRFISELLDVDAIALDGGLTFRWMGEELPEPEPAPEPHLVALTRMEDVERSAHRALLHACRDAVCDLQRFTIGEIADYLGVDKREAKAYLDELPAGLVRDTGQTWRRSPLYEYSPPDPNYRFRRPDYSLPEHDAVANFIAPPRGQVAAGGCPRVSAHKDVQTLVEKAWRAGWPVKPGTSGSHAKLLPPKGRPITVPGTPSGGMLRVFRDRLQDCGLNVKNRQGGAKHKDSKQNLGQPRVRSDVGRAAIAATGAGVHGGTKKQRNKRERKAGNPG